MIHLAGSVRTPFGSLCGAFADVSAVEAGKVPVERFGVKPEDVKNSSWGNILERRPSPKRGAPACPLLNLMARNDDLVPCCQSEPLNDLVSSTDKEKIIWPAGHIGLAVSGRAQKELWPRAVDWLVQRTD